MNTSLTIKLLFLSLVCFPQLASAFVWENTDEKRSTWKKIVSNAVIKECSTNPTGECVRNSPIIPLIRDTCGKVPPNVRPIDHQEIYRASCVNDAEVGVSQALTEVTDKQRAASEAARQDALRARQRKELDERDRKIALQKKQDDDRDLQRKLEQENQRTMEAKRQQDLEAIGLENQKKMERLLK